MRSIVDMNKELIEAVMRIECASFSEPWSFQAFASEIRNPLSWFKVIGCMGEDGQLSKVEGFIVCWRLDGELHLLNLAIHPASRRLGLGRRLMESAVEDFSQQGGGEVSLEVRLSNQPAQRLYLSMGFQVVGRRSRYYQNNQEDALLMARLVPPAPTSLRNCQGFH